MNDRNGARWAATAVGRNRTNQAGAELIAERTKCEAITSYGLELPWRLRTGSCSECSSLMQLDEGDLTALRERLIEVRVRVDALIGLSPQAD